MTDNVIPVLLKRGTTVSSDERVIDYNDLVKSKLKHIIEIQNNKDNIDADGFVNGLKADVVEQLLRGSEDDMNEEAATDASYEAQAASIIEYHQQQKHKYQMKANKFTTQAHIEADRAFTKRVKKKDTNKVQKVQDRNMKIRRLSLQEIMKQRLNS